MHIGVRNGEHVMNAVFVNDVQHLHPVHIQKNMHDGGEDQLFSHQHQVIGYNVDVNQVDHHPSERELIGLATLKILQQMILTSLGH